jgi:adenylyl-sulfate kinase
MWLEARRLTNYVWQVARENHLTTFGSLVSTARRGALLGQRGAVLWLTGLSASGKTTLALELEKRLFERQKLAYRLDGDNLRSRLCQDLGFAKPDRDENIRRAAEVAHLLADAGVITICAFISPYRAARAQARQIAAPHPFLEVFVDTPLEVCKARDPRGLYAKAETGALSQFTGVSAPYEPPERPELRIDTSQRSQAACVDRLVELLIEHEIIDRGLGKT